MTPDLEPTIPVPVASVIITPTEMYREMQDIGKKVDRLSAVVDPAINTIREDIMGVKQGVRINSDRIRSLEHWRWSILGAAAVISAAFTALGAVVLAQVLS